MDLTSGGGGGSSDNMNEWYVGERQRERMRRKDQCKEERVCGEVGFGFLSRLFTTATTTTMVVWWIEWEYVFKRWAGGIRTYAYIPTYIRFIRQTTGYSQLGS